MEDREVGTEDCFWLWRTLVFEDDHLRFYLLFLLLRHGQSHCLDEHHVHLLVRQVLMLGFDASLELRESRLELKRSVI